MKKLFWVVALLVLLSVPVIYLIFPKEVKISTLKIIPANDRAVYRTLINEQNWKKWWPTGMGHQENLSNEFNLNGYQFKIGTKQSDGMEVIITDKSLSVSSLLSLSRLSPDTLWIKWTASFSNSGNFFDRINSYLKAKRIKKSMDEILNRLNTFSTKTENLYGIDIKQTKVTDTLLLVIKKEQNIKPTEAEIYFNIAVIKEYINVKQAKESNYPMLHISHPAGLATYTITVAIPVNKRLPETELIKVKRMVPGNILFADVQGGPLTIETAKKQMENFVFDNLKISPAMPFELLITDRTLEKDTAKWVTRLYYPIL